MSARRVLLIGLDGFEESLGRELIAAGELPHIARMRERSARYLLDHGPAQRTGLAWEHVATGLSPEDAGRWAAVHFDPATYAAWQEGTSLAPFPGRLRARTVVFDAPYFDLSRAPNVRGLVGWGAHDPGVPPQARPDDVRAEVEARFGPYPAKPWIYGHVWPSAARAREMGEKLALAAQVRARAARWVLAERLPDWDLGVVVVSEPHSALEGLWHGGDATHPLHSLPSAGPARDGLLAVHRAVDDLVGELAGAFPDAAVVLFATGGMGPNRSDVASMALLPELLYRHAFGAPLLRQPDAWTEVGGAGPRLGENDNWANAINAHYPPAPRAHPARRLIGRLVPERVKRALRADPGGAASAGHDSDAASRRHDPHAASRRHDIGWMPATRYRPFWQQMPAFALPSFYDGRVRVNLAGREAQGRVPPAGYAGVCSEIEALLRACRDPATGKGVVDFIERPATRDPLALGATESDLVVVWKGMPCALDHPILGRVGPLPYRRPGGHTGPHGLAYFHNAGVGPGDYGVRSTFDVVPALIELLGEPRPAGLSGAGLFAAGANPRPLSAEVS